MNKLKNIAEILHSMGANVLPIRSGKKPAISWDRLQNERQSLEEVQSYDWNNCTGISIVCGINGYICFDIDKAQNDAPLIAVLQALGLPDDYQWQAKSGSGNGYHLWITTNETLNVGTDSGVIKGKSRDGSFDHIELRWRDCQTLVPPSLHESGNNYEWFYGQPTAAPAVVTVDQLVNAFGQLADMEVSKSETKTPEFRMTEYVNILTNGVGEGSRNTTVAKLAGRYSRLGMPYSEALVLLKMWNDRLTNPLAEDEVERTVLSIYSYSKEVSRFYTGTEMSLLAQPVVSDIVADVIRDQSLVFLAGEEGSGKSLTAMNLAIAVATGAPKFLNYDIQKTGKVIYLNNELPFEDFLLRFKKMRTDLSSEQLSRLGNFIAPDIVIPLADFLPTLYREIDKNDPVMVVLDCLYWAHSQKENDSSEMKSLMRQLVEIRDTRKLAMIVVHHTKKGVRNETMHNDNMRGSSVFGGATDSVLMFRRSGTDEAKRLIKPTKLRHGADEVRQARLLELEPSSLWFRDIGEADESEHFSNNPEGGSSRPKAEETIDWGDVFGEEVELQRQVIVERCKDMRMSERTVDRCLKSAVNKGELRSLRKGVYTLPNGESDLPLSPDA